MPRSLADVASHDPSRLLRWLCNHWRHKFEIEHRDDQSVLIPMGEVGAVEFTITPGVLHIDAQHADDGQLPRLQQVIANHLERFARDETLVFDWRNGA